MPRFDLTALVDLSIKASGCPTAAKNSPVPAPSDADGPPSEARRD
jgi:hypothetical protein